MRTEVLWIPVGIFVAFYILYLQFQIWLKNRVIEAMSRPPSDEFGIGLGSILFALAVLIGVAVYVASSI